MEMELHVVLDHSCPFVVLVEVQEVSHIASRAVTNEERGVCVAGGCRKGLKDGKVGGKRDEKGMERWVLLERADTGCSGIQTLDIRFVPEA